MHIHMHVYIIENSGNDSGKRIYHSNIDGVNIRWYHPLWKTDWQFIYKLNMLSTYNPAFFKACARHRKKDYVHTKTCPQIFVAGFF